MHSIDVFAQNNAVVLSQAPISTQDIESLETKLQACLPQAYKYLISTYGLVHTPNVLSKVCDLNVAITDVHDFLSLEDVSSLSSLYELSGMPAGHILFASDCKGNMFCFKAGDCAEQQDDIAVWYYDHTLATVVQVSDSFIYWLTQTREA